MSFVLLTRRDAHTDFRVYLARALQAAGHPCYIVRPFRRSTISCPFSTDVQSTVGVLDLMRALRHLARTERPLIIIDSLNLGLPLLCVVLRFLTWPAIWAYDLHDHLLYDLHGPSRLLGILKLRMHHALATFGFHAAPTLAELFPRSHRLGNASHLRRRQGRRADTSNILILASIDERFDFALLHALAENTSLTFHIYGSLAEGSTPATRRRIQKAMATLVSRPNILHHGTYVNADLESILSRFSVMLAPYRLGDTSTRYIEPLRYHHAHNNGVAVLTTDIPAARIFAGRVAVIWDRPSFEWALAGVAERQEGAGLNEAEVTWEQRASQLVEIASLYMRAESR